MASASRRLKRQLGKPAPSFDHLKIDLGFVSPVIQLTDDLHAICAAVLIEAIDPSPSRFGHTALDNGPVKLGYPAGPKVGRQSPRGLAGFRQEHNTRGRAVEPVQQADVNVPRLGISHLEVLADQIDQAGIARTVALLQQSGGLVYGQTMVVFKESL